jgi:hypothetical protein
VKQGTTAKTVGWPCVLLHFHYHMAAEVPQVTKNCLNIRFRWIECVLRTGTEHYSIIIKTFTVCATGVAIMLLMVQYNYVSVDFIVCTR